MAQEALNPVQILGINSQSYNMHKVRYIVRYRPSDRVPGRRLLNLLHVLPMTSVYMSPCSSRWQLLQPLALGPRSQDHADNFMNRFMSLGSKRHQEEERRRLAAHPTRRGG